MVESWSEADTQYFEKIFQTFDNHPDWEYTDSHVSREDAPQKSVEAVLWGSIQEYQFDHADTDADLWLAIPHNEGAVVGTMHHRATSARFEKDDGLVSALDETQQEIARRHAMDTEYLQIDERESSGDIANLGVPLNYDGGAFSSALDALSATSREVEEMHDDLFETLDSYE